MNLSYLIFYFFVGFIFGLCFDADIDDDDNTDEEDTNYEVFKKDKTEKK